MKEWVKIIINSLKEHDISVISYIPDISIDNITKEIESDNYFTVIPATREEECIGIASGSYISGVNAAIFMQSSGFGNCINALASLNIPARIPIPMFINLRGEIGEFNIAQVTMGRSTKPILDLLNIPHITLDSEINLQKNVSHKNAHAENDQKHSKMFLKYVFSPPQAKTILVPDAVF